MSSTAEAKIVAKSPGGRKAGAKKTFRVKPVSAQADANGSAKLRLKLAKSKQRKLQGLLKDGWKAKAKAKVKATGATRRQEQRQGFDHGQAGLTAGDEARRARAFGAEAEAYELGRPGYPRAAIEFCIGERPQRVLDLGAGTGKLTAELLALGHEVVAVEPLEPMRARIPAEAEALDGSAESIPLEDASVDAVAVGQAFHWFDQAAALAEIVRVLRPGGSLGLLWNLLDDDVPWVAAVADAFDAEDRASLAGELDAAVRGRRGARRPDRRPRSGTFTRPTRRA